MKKAAFIFTFLLGVTYSSFAQPGSMAKAAKQLEANLSTIDDLSKMLLNDYEMKTTGVDVVSGAKFKMNGCLVLGSYGDEGFQKQIKSMEKEFGDTFDNSIWAYEKFDPNGQSMLSVKTVSGKIESSPYTGFKGSATVRVGTLIEGLTMESYFYEKKKDKNQYLVVFAVGNGISCVMDMTKQ